MQQHHQDSNKAIVANTAKDDNLNENCDVFNSLNNINIPLETIKPSKK